MPVEVDTRDLVQRNMTMVVTLKRYNQWLFRLQLASLLARLAAWVAWVGIKFEDMEDNKGDRHMHWHRNFDERQLKEIAFSRYYANNYGHGTDGHNAKLIIAKFADLMDLQEIQQQEWPKSEASESEND